MKTYFNHLYLHIHFLKYFLQTIFRINSFGCCRKSRSRRVYDRFESRCWQNWSSKDWNIDDSPRCLFSGKLCFFGCFPSRCRKIRAKYLWFSSYIRVTKFVLHCEILTCNNVDLLNFFHWLHAFGKKAENQLFTSKFLCTKQLVIFYALI